MANIYIETFGCQMNEADSQYIADRAAAAGYAIVADAGEASVVVLNTCTVRDNAERRAYGRIAHFKALKERRSVAEAGRMRLPGRTGSRPHAGCGAARRRGLRNERVARLGDQLAAWRPGFSDDGPEVEERALASSRSAAEADASPMPFRTCAPS